MEWVMTSSMEKTPYYISFHPYKYIDRLTHGMTPKSCFFGSLTSPEKKVFKSDHGKVANLHNFKMAAISTCFYLL